MKLAEFDRLTKEALSDALVSVGGFSFRNGTFFRDLASGVRHVVVVDFDTRTTKTFRVILGFNASLLSGDLPADEAGVYGVQYLGPKSLSRTPVTFLCMDKSAAAKSLATVAQALQELALPLFASVQTVERMAAVVEDQYPVVKGQLLLHAGLRGEAKIWLTKHVAYLRAQRNAESDPAWIETQRLLRQCEA